MVTRCYPGGKTKAFNITYDDGILQDVRFVALLNKYGLKGTFNLNSQLMEQEFEWIHPNGMTVKRLSRDAVRRLYDGHEIAAHTLTHPFLNDKSEEELHWEIGGDKRRLGALFGREVAGVGVPFDYYDEKIAECVRNCGFEYGRMSEETRSYIPWQDPFFWRCGLFHLAPELDDFIEGFFQTEEELALCQIVGHSYDLDAENLWGKMECILVRMAENAAVCSLTHLELVRYLRAMERSVITEDRVENNSSENLWFRVDGQILSLAPGECWEGSKQ